MIKNTVLIVEDVNIVARDIQSKLKRSGYAIAATVASGEEAIKKAAETQPNLVLMDIQLRGKMNGIEAARQIYTQFDVPVVYLTANADESTLEQAKVTGPFGYIIKPFSIAELRSTIEIALYKHQMERKLRKAQEDLESRVQERTAALSRTNEDLKKQISDRRYAEEELRKSEKRLRQIINLVPHHIFVKNRNGNFLIANQAVADAYGTTIERLIGQNHAEIHKNAREVAEMIKDDLEVIESGEQKLIPERDFTDKDGNRRILQVTKIPYSESDSNDPAVLGIAIDITDRKLAEAQLIDASKLAAIGELAASVAHEILNPINGLLNCAEMLIPEFEEGSDNWEFAELIKSEGERIVKTVRNLLNFSRQQEEEYRMNRLCDIVSRSLALVGKQIQKYRIQLRIDVPEDLPAFQCRAGQIQQVIMNLLLNSCDALNERFPVGAPDKILSVSATQLYHEGKPHLQLIVEDHGCGIAPENLSRLFNPFFTTKPLGQGTGLGLSTSYRLIKNHGGLITIESKLGKFTRFYVNLPLKKQAVPQM